MAQPIRASARSSGTSLNDCSGIEPPATARTQWLRTALSSGGRESITMRAHSAGSARPQATASVGCSVDPVAEYV